MAIASYTQIVANTDNFEAWLNRTNQLIEDMRTTVVTEGNNNVFDLEIDGNFEVSNTVYIATALRGGTLAAPAALAINSNTVFSATSDVTFQSIFTHNAPTKAFSVNANSSIFDTGHFKVLNGSNTHITSANVTINYTNNAFFTLSGVEKMSLDNAGNLKINGDTVINQDKVFKVGSGNTAARPGSPTAGQFWFNSETVEFEGYNGSDWKKLDFDIELSSNTNFTVDTALLATRGTIKAFADALYVNITGETITGGITYTSENLGTVSSGTVTLSASTSNIKRLINGGAFTLAAPSSGDFSCVLQITNNASAGIVTLSGFTTTSGDDLTVTNGDDFMLFVTRVNGFIHLHIQALQ